MQGLISIFVGRYVQYIYNFSLSHPKILGVHAEKDGRSPHYSFLFLFSILKLSFVMIFSEHCTRWLRREKSRDEQVFFFFLDHEQKLSGVIGFP